MATWTDHIVEDLGGAIWVEIPSLSAAATSCTVAIEDDGGTSKLASTAATVSPLSTTLEMPARSGSRSFKLAALAVGDIAPGVRFKVVPAQGAAQVFTCKERDETDDVLYSYEAVREELPYAAPIIGIRVTYTVAAAVADERWWNGRAIWTPTVSGSAIAPTIERLHCVAVRLDDVLATERDLRRIVPTGLLERVITETDDLPGQLWEARQDVIEDLTFDAGGEHELAHTIVGAGTMLARLHALRWRMLRRAAWGEAALNWEEAAKDYDRELLRARTLYARDRDQDGVLSDDEQGPFAWQTVRG